MQQRAMQQAMTYWRKAATLILAVRHDASLKPSVEHFNSDNPQTPVNCEDYKILMLKRNKSSSFFPSSFVFPGGSLSPVDDSCDWKPLFERVTGEKIDNIAQYFRVEAGLRPPIISESISDRSDGVSTDIAFRICAIRETFEECGVLLATDRKSLAPCLIDVDLKAWQRRVSQNASEFFTMCQQLSVVPNIWLLYEWSNWMTPVMERVGPSAKPKRFDTLFYMCILHDSVLPNVTLDNEEIVDYVWTSPSQYLRNHSGITPQIYEMSRLTKLDRLSDLYQFTKKRQDSGVERLMSVRLMCKDAVLMVLPGDILYPENPDTCGTQPADINNDLMEKSYVEICGDGSHAMHRNVILHDGKTLLISNREPSCNHLAPTVDMLLSKL